MNIPREPQPQHSYQGFDYHYWADPTSSGAFQPKLEISKYYENRKETLKKLFVFETTFKSASKACDLASQSAPEIIDGLHPTMSVDDIALP